MVEFRGCDFAYEQGTWAMNSLTHRFEGGRLHSIIGPSGCGKTTLLYLAAGLHSPDRGEVLVHGDRVRRGRPDTAVILQDFGLFPWKSVYDNLAIGLRIRSFDRIQIDRRIDAVLDELGLSGKEHLYPKHLSGGEKQRLAVGRALVVEPDVLLMDEPFSALDAMTREGLQDRLLAIHEHHTMTILLVTHSIEEAAYVSDTIHVMDRGARITLLANTAHGNDRSSPDFFSCCVGVRSLLRGLESV